MFQQCQNNVNFQRKGSGLVLRFLVSLSIVCSLKLNVCVWPFVLVPVSMLWPSGSHGPGGGVLSTFVRRGCAIFQGIIFAYFARTGYQKKASFLEQVVKTCQKEEILLQQVII